MTQNEEKTCTSALTSNSRPKILNGARSRKGRRGLRFSVLGFKACM